MFKMNKTQLMALLKDNYNKQMYLYEVKGCGETHPEILKLEKEYMNIFSQYETAVKHG